LTGFLTSALCGGFIGDYVDTYGRKFGCIVFCVLEVIINLLEHIPDVNILFVGRILGGVTTNLLFSAFESWMVAEHRKLGFKESLLASTFAISSWGNGLVAIGAGFIAQWSVTGLNYGDIGPFQVAIALTIVCLVLILFCWGENYGREKPPVPMLHLATETTVVTETLVSPVATPRRTRTAAKDKENATETTCVSETLISPVPTPRRSGSRSRSRGSLRSAGNSDVSLSSASASASGKRSGTPNRTSSKADLAASDAQGSAAKPSPRRTRSRAKLSSSSSGNDLSDLTTAKKPRAVRGGLFVDTSSTSSVSSCSGSDSAPTSAVSPVSPVPKSSTDEGKDKETCTIPDTRHIMSIMYNHPEIWMLGLSQACFEGAVYTFGKISASFVCPLCGFMLIFLFDLLGFFLSVCFSLVFMWVPVLLSVYPAAFPETPSVDLPPLPTGLCFSCFMLAMTLGGMLFSLIISMCKSGGTADAGTGAGAEGGVDSAKLSAADEDSMNLLCIGIYLISAGALLLPILSYDFTVIFASFLLLESMVGMFNAGSGTLRSVYYIESHQSSIISIFRIPLNLLVVSGTLLTNNPDIDNQFVFGVLIGLQLMAATLQLALYLYIRGSRKASA